MLYPLDDDNDQTYEAADTALIADIIEDIDAELEIALASSFTTPSDLAGNVWLKARAVDLCSERLLTRKGGNPPPSVAEQATRTREWLEMVRKREIRVPYATYPGDGFDTERRQMGLPRVVNPGGA